MKAIIYHNARCSKSRETRSLLESRGVELEVVEYLKTPPTKETLEDLLGMLGIGACQLIRKSEALYKDQFETGVPTDEACLKAMIENPILIERPIVVVGDHAVLGRPPENVLKLIKEL